MCSGGVPSLGGVAAHFEHFRSTAILPHQLEIKDLSPLLGRPTGRFFLGRNRPMFPRVTGIGAPWCGLHISVGFATPRPVSGLLLPCALSFSVGFGRSTRMGGVSVEVDVCVFKGLCGSTEMGV